MPPADPTVLTLEDLRDLYCTRTIHEAAKDLDVGLTALKRRCRVLGIRRWPYRTVRSRRLRQTSGHRPACMCCNAHAPRPQLSSLEKLLDDVRNIREELTEEDKKKQQVSAHCAAESYARGMTNFSEVAPNRVRNSKPSRSCRSSTRPCG